MTERVDVVVIGAGAAGLFCAIEAAKRGREVLVLDHANKAGKKILMSGGGRCNFTNMEVLPQHYLSENPHFFRSALSRYTQWDFIGLVAAHGIAYHEKSLGQLFCDHSSKDILNMLLNELEQSGAKLRLNTSITSISDDDSGRFRIEASNQTWIADALVVATGGLSIPTMGASDFGYQIARQYGHAILETRASLVPFTWNNRDKDKWTDLSGVSLPATVTAQQGQAFSLDVLITHRGLSGPAMLQISNYWKPGETLEIDWLPGQNCAEQLKQDRHEQGKKSLKNWLTQWMPARLAEHFCQLLGMSKTLAELTKADVEKVDQVLHRWEFVPGGTEGYRTAEVTKGGVDTNQVSSKTMESQLRSNLYFIGEVLDVTGWLGGYNFQWAWSSAWAAAQDL